LGTHAGRILLVGALKQSVAVLRFRPNGFR
jgi:hypothetical protein